MKTMSLSSGFINSLKLIGFALVVCLCGLAAMQPAPPPGEWHPDPEPPPVMTPSLKLFQQKTARIHPDMTEAQVRRLLGPPSTMASYPLFNSGHTYGVWWWDAPGDPDHGYSLHFDENGQSMPAGMYPD